MNTQSNAIAGSSAQSPQTLPAGRAMYWSIRRELWENRSIYIGPLAAAVVFLFGFVINMAAMRRHIAASPLDPAQQHNLLANGYELSGALIMGTALIVGVFYSLDAMYGERRDRSILFWKSLPVSDLTTVLSKLIVPILILPLVSFIISLATQFIMLLLSSIMLQGSGVNIPALWTEASFFHVSVVLLYHLLTVHGLWYTPIYGWLLMVSAWAPRAPFIWAFLPPFVICGVEKVAFNTTHFLELLGQRLMGPGSAMAGSGNVMAGTGNRMAAHQASNDLMATLIPHHFLSEPGLWIGLAIAAAFIAVAVRLRRYRGPI